MAAGTCALRIICNQALKELMQHNGMPEIGAVLHLKIVAARRVRQLATQPEP